MKKFLVLATAIAITFLFIPALTFADNGCPLAGNTYFLEIEDVKYELSGFDCIYGPGCNGSCDLWYGDFDTGPLYHTRLPFQCYTDGSVIISGLPCGLTSNGNLECLLVDTSGYTCYVIGDRTWCVPEDGVVLDFKQE